MFKLYKTYYNEDGIADKFPTEIGQYDTYEECEEVINANITLDELYTEDDFYITRKD